MKTDRLQGIIIPNDTPSSAGSGHRVSYIKRALNKFHKNSTPFSELERRYIEVRADYADLIAADLLDRLKIERER